MRPGVLFTWPMTRYAERTAVVFGKDRFYTFETLGVKLLEIKC